MIEPFIKAIQKKDSDTLSHLLSETVFLRDADESITRDKTALIETLLRYHDNPFDCVKPYESFYVVNVRENMEMKIKMNNQKIAKIYIRAIPLNQRRIRLDFSYDGSQYFGFQKQVDAHKPSIQKTMETVLAHITQEQSKIIAAGRTDKGVHAFHQTAHFDTYSPLSIAKIKTLLNTMLPFDIRIIKVSEAPGVFHARYDCLNKTYLYKITHAYDPFKAHYMHYVKTVDLTQLNTKLALLKGTHDFIGFSKLALDKPTIRTLDYIEAIHHHGETHIIIKASGFLRHMVRIIVGNALKDITGGKTTIEQALNTPSKNNVKYMAPAEGLYLYSLEY